MKGDLVKCAICGKFISKDEAKYDNGYYLCKDCDTQALLDRLPSAGNAMPFKVTKRICKSTGRVQFLTSGYPNRSKDKKVFSSMDGLFMPNLLPDLKANEYDHRDGDGKPATRQGIEVDVHFSRVKQEGWHEVWVFGTRGKSRMITPFEPKSVRRGEESTHAVIKHGAMYISTWCDRDYFPDMPEDATFPVYIKVSRKNK